MTRLQTTDHRPQTVPVSCNQMSALYYLTIQDMLWINHRVTGSVNAFRYDELEQATFFQYGYGKSLDLEKQAARFLLEFPKKAPFDEGNEAAAFVGFVSFLRANGKDLQISDKDAKAWASGNVDEAGIQKRIIAGEEVHGQPNMEALIEGVVVEFAGALPVLVGA